MKPIIVLLLYLQMNSCGLPFLHRESQKDARDAPEIVAALTQDLRDDGVKVSESCQEAMVTVLRRWHTSYREVIPQKYLGWILNSTAELSAVYPEAAAVVWEDNMLAKIEAFAALSLRKEFADNLPVFEEAFGGRSDSLDLQTGLDLEYGHDSVAAMTAASELPKIIQSFDTCLLSSSATAKARKACVAEKSVAEQRFLETLG